MSTIPTTVHTKWIQVPLNPTVHETSPCFPEKPQKNAIHRSKAIWLVVSSPLKNMGVSWDGLSHIYIYIYIHILPIGSMYGIYTNIGGILMVNLTIYSSTMDPMGYGKQNMFQTTTRRNEMIRALLVIGYPTMPLSPQQRICTP